MTTSSIAAIPYSVKLQNGRHEFAADEPKDIGGADTAPSPEELLEASLASCTAITLRMYANRKQWPVAGIAVTVTIEKMDNKTVFNRSININGTVNEEQRQRLLQIARSCPVSKILLGEIDIQSNNL